MRLCRFIHRASRETGYGLVEDEQVAPLGNFTFNLFALLGAGGVLDESRLTRLSIPPVPLSEVRILAPVEPSKIVCVGRNYQDHAAELGNAMPSEPLLFLKPPSSVVGHEEIIELPHVSARVEYEGELGVVIGRRARRLDDAEDPLAYVFGYTCVNDVTARDLQRRDVQFTRAKSFDTFCPVGPFVSTGLNPADLSVRTHVNSQTRQSGRTSAMAFPVAYLIRYISHIMTLEPGDIISTGTPAGVGPLTDGDVVEVEVEGVGVLRNTVRVDASAAATSQAEAGERQADA
jgi:2-keto-4-pentenoate hydratase/2-oxohepta-3-ene-1,7-dioic acid hydratase in catechol pathway